ncbi:MAG: hypothetical protein H0W15_03295 [Gemmatimonadales bacterium]|nr:hypothetical protein [Gemmatimonadales bacterium]
MMYPVLMVAMVTLAACDSKPDSADAPAADTSHMMAAAPMTMAGMGMLPGMRAHLDSVAAMPPTQMAAMMPAHEGLVTRMMDAMGTDMRGKGMQPSPAWTALSDSVRQDLAEMPKLSGKGLTTSLQAHAARMQRMMVMHEGMMRM